MGIGPTGENLIFLLSQQRAGSTLLQRILAGHPEVHTTAEPWLMLHPIYALRQAGHQADYNAALAFKGLQDFCGTLEGGQEHYVEALRRMAVHLYDTACQQAGRSYFLDKTPRYYLIIPELVRVFPAAKFVILLRNPLAVLASILNTWVKDHWVLLPRYRDDLLVAPKRLLAGMELLGDRAIVVRYEELVSDPVGQVRAVCDRLGLEFDPGMVEYGRVPKPAGDLGDPTGVAKHSRPTRRSLDRWLEMGETSQTRQLAEGYLRALGPDLLAGLGYNYDDLAASLRDIPCKAGRIVFSWKQVVQPDPALQKRLVFVELALLEHRRLVHQVRRWMRARFCRRSRTGRRGTS